jgi:hypothetical protein
LYPFRRVRPISPPPTTTTAAPRSPESQARQILPALKALLDKAGVPKQARILQLGGASGGQLPSATLAGIAGPIFLVDAEGQDAPPRVTRVGGDPFSAELPEDIDFCIALPGLVRIPDMMEGLLYDSIHGALREGGIVALLFPRDTTDRTLIAQGATAIRVRSTLQSFLTAHFGGQTIDDPQAIAAKFGNCSYYEFVGLATRGKGAFDAEAMVWLVLRKRAGAAPKLRKRPSRAFARTTRPDQFSLDDLAKFIGGMKGGGIEFVTVDVFAERYAAYLALDAKTRRKFNTPFGLLKFDIHGNIRRAYEIAQMLRGLDVPGLFLMMHKHPLNQDYYGYDSTWRMLRRIQASGHEIGIHADPFCLIRDAGDLHKGFKDAIIDLRQRGLTIRSATLHGDTREHIKARGLQANDFFRERYRKTKWDGQPPEGEEMLAEHAFKYSHQRLAGRFGLEYFAEVNFLRQGELLTTESMLYVSDNARAIRISSIPKWIAPVDQMSAEKPFVIDDAFIAKATGVLKKRPFLALFHPQWYW